MTDWSESYIKLEQSHKALKDALNQELYDDAEDFLFQIMTSTSEMMEFVAMRIAGMEG